MANNKLTALKHQKHECPECRGTFPASSVKLLAIFQMIFSFIIMATEALSMATASMFHGSPLCYSQSLLPGFWAGITSIMASGFGIYTSRRCSTSTIRMYLCSSLLCCVSMTTMNIIVIKCLFNSPSELYLKKIVECVQLVFGFCVLFSSLHGAGLCAISMFLIATKTKFLLTTKSFSKPVVEKGFEEIDLNKSFLTTKSLYNPVVDKGFEVIDLNASLPNLHLIERGSVRGSVSDFYESVPMEGIKAGKIISKANTLGTPYLLNTIEKVSHI